MLPVSDWGVGARGRAGVAEREHGRQEGARGAEDASGGRELCLAFHPTLIRNANTVLLALQPETPSVLCCPHLSAPVSTSEISREGAVLAGGFGESEEVLPSISNQGPGS